MQAGQVSLMNQDQREEVSQAHHNVPNNQPGTEPI